MDALVDAFLRSLDRGAPDAQLLATVGDDDPARAADDFLEAVRQPDLAGHTRLWVPPLLRSARPGFGARCLCELSRLRNLEGARLEIPRTPTLSHVLGSSNFLARHLLNDPDWTDDLLGDVPDAPTGVPAPDWQSIRIAKYRGLLRIAARDLVGRPFAASLRELSDLADGCLVAALACAAAETARSAPALFALGKLGGRELNFSSDVDLMFVYRSQAGCDVLQENQDAATLIRLLKTELEAPTTDGFAYRVDLDLRPEGRTGVLANSVEAALGYYESFGAEWERQMLIRLRSVAGPEEPSAAFAEEITPFVYRRLIDPSVMHNVRSMKDRIERERREDGRDVAADLKEGPGGIRDIEFLVQSLQLFHGGRQPTLRSGNVLDTLATLEELDLLPQAVTRSLADSYLWLRRAEHALQLPEEQQTAQLPRNAIAQTALARRMGYADADGRRARERLLEDWTAVRTQTRAHFDALVLSDGR